jgi:hypothetical protein
MRGRAPLSELTFAPLPPRPELLRQLRGRLEDLAPGLRVVAESLLGAEARIDFVGIEASGRVVLAIVGSGEDDLALVARALAQRTWVESRLRDWLQLAPNLGLRPEAGVRVWLLAPRFRAESLAAARAAGGISLAIFRWVRNGAGADALVEALGDPAEAEKPSGSPSGRVPAQFRSGLSDVELGLSPEERREFE